MPNLGGAELLVILLVALLVLGPDKLPGAARSVGRGLSQLRRMSSGFEQEIRSAMGEADTAAAQKATPTPVAGAGVHPGLGPGPRLEAGSVALGPSSGNGADPGAGAGAGGSAVRPVVEGPDESFS